MKALKIIGTVILLLFMILISIGLFIPAFDYENSITIQTSPEKCWSIYTDTTLRKNWIEGFHSYRLLEGDPFTAGAKYESTIISGETMVMFEQITSIEPAKKISIHLTNDVLTSDYSYSFKGNAAQTEITTHYHIEGNNIFMRAILLVSKSYLKRSDNKMLERLKHVVENGN